MIIPLLLAAAAFYAYHRNSQDYIPPDGAAKEMGITDFSKSHGPYTDPTLELVVGNPLLRTSNLTYHQTKPQTVIYGQWGIPRMDVGTQRGGLDSILVFANPGGKTDNPLQWY